MINKNLFIQAVFFVILTNGAFALTGVSNNYSVSMFGNSISTGNANSNSYIATFLSENLGTTSNAQSNSFVGNIGFFETGYFTTVSITSYSISPITAVIGSTIELSITASNVESVWVEITSPDSQVQTLNLVNGQTLNYLPVPSIVGRYQVIFYARGSTGAIASISDYFDLIEQSSGSSSSSSGSSGSSGGGTIQSCNYNWDCTPWSLCSNGLQTRTCANIGTCIGQESRPIESMSCSQALFDITLNLEGISLTDGNVRFDVSLIEQFGVEELDVHLKYSIIDEENYELFSQIETKSIKGSLSFEKIIDFDLENGNYILRVDVLYGNLQRAFAEQSFVVSNGNIDEFEGNGITGFTLIDYIDSRRITFSILSLLISLTLLITYFYVLRDNKIVKVSNSLNNTIGLDVYTGGGMKLGKVYDIILKDNIIYGIAVLIEKGVPVHHDRVLIRYEYIDDINDVVLVNSSVLENNSHESA